MNKHTLNRLALLFIVVALSGCVGQSATGGGASAGVIIKSFGPDISEIFSYDDVVFSLSVENVGGADAENVQAKIFGLGTDWEYTKEKQYVGGDGFLEKSQPDLKIPGGIGDIQWTVTSPPDLRVDNTYTAGVRLYYDYETISLATVKVYNSDYLRTKPEEAESIMASSGVETFTVTDAPVTIELAGLARPLIYRSSGQKASVTALISNVGQGVVYQDDEKRPEVTIDYIKVYGDSDACESDVDGVVRLPRTGKKSVSCNFELESVDVYTTIPIEVKLSYKYFLDSTNSIKVLKSLFINGETTTTGPTIPTP